MENVPPSKTIARFGHWALLCVVVLMGSALVVTVWATNRGVHDASETMVRGQADVLRAAVRSRLTKQKRTLGPEELQEIFDEHRRDGLRYVGVFKRNGDLIAQMGEPLDTNMQAVLQGSRTGKPQRVEGRVRLVVGGRARKGRRAGRAVTLVIEFEPRAADKLHDHAERSLLVGAISAGALVFIAIVLVRWYIRREELERRLEQDRRLASLGQMSAVLAHEIRNPIASLKGNAQLLVRMVPKDDERVRRKAERVVDETLRLESLTNDLLEFARAGELRRSAVDPAALAREVAELQGGEIQINATDAPKKWSLDADRIRQVLTNLFANASEASDLPVEVAILTTAGELVYSVRDWGDGIDAEDVERIFEPFYTRKTRGTGLGLAVCKRLVELHDGTISAFNAPDGGAVFRISIPK